MAATDSEYATPQPKPKTKQTEFSNEPREMAQSVRHCCISEGALVEEFEPPEPM